MPKAIEQKDNDAENAEKVEMSVGTVCRIFMNLSKNGCIGKIDENVLRFLCRVSDIMENDAAVTAADALLIIDEVIIGSD